MAFRRSGVRAPYPPLKKAFRDNKLRKAFLLVMIRPEGPVQRRCNGGRGFGRARSECDPAWPQLKLLWRKPGYAQPASDRSTPANG